MSNAAPLCIEPDWPAPAQVRACTTTRHGGVSRGPYASMNPADHVGDDPHAVAQNRRRLVEAQELPAEPVWMQQVHGTVVVDAAGCAGVPVADAAWTDTPGVVCAVMTADCLPLLLCDRGGTVVAAVHAGWRGLAIGIIEQGVASLGADAQDILAWMGPAISQAAYQVGDEVRDTFIQAQPDAAAAFVRQGAGWGADLYELARQRLARCGVTAVYGGRHCSAGEPGLFYSYRRDGVTGRMASLIWLDMQRG